MAPARRLVRGGHRREYEEEQELNLRRALHLVGAGALTGALLLGSAPTASAESIRDRQWALEFFAAKDIWDHATGKGVTVAVVDDGVHSSQPDLKGSVLPGKTYSQGSVKTDQADDGRHGTAMAALIAAHGHGPGNKLGMKGLAPEAKIMPITVRSGSSHAQGIRYAVDHGAKVINLSYGGNYDQGERDAVKYAISKNAVVVAASGNSGIKYKEYPAAYPGVVSVGGFGRDGQIWDDSSWGSHVSLIAPAEHNITPNPKYESGYGYTDGTSDAAAYVSASAALVREAHPNLTGGQVINRLIKSAKPLTDAQGNAPKLPDAKFGYGIVRPYRAVTYDYPAGPKEGPLAQESDQKASKSAPAASPDDSSSSSAPSWLYVLGTPLNLILVVLGVLIVVAVAIALVVKKGKGGGRGPGGPGGPSGGMPPMPRQGQQHQSSAGQFGGPPTSPPPPPSPSR